MLRRARSAGGRSVPQRAGVVGSQPERFKENAHDPISQLCLRNTFKPIVDYLGRRGSCLEDGLLQPAGCGALTEMDANVLRDERRRQNCESRY